VRHGQASASRHAFPVNAREFLRGRDRGRVLPSHGVVVAEHEPIAVDWQDRRSPPRDLVDTLGGLAPMIVVAMRSAAVAMPGQAVDVHAHRGLGQRLAARAPVPRTGVGGGAGCGPMPCPPSGLGSQATRALFRRTPTGWWLAPPQAGRSTGQEPPVRRASAPRRRLRDHAASEVARVSWRAKSSMGIQAMVQARQGISVACCGPAACEGQPRGNQRIFQGATRRRAGLNGGMRSPRATTGWQPAGEVPTRGSADVSGEGEPVMVHPTSRAAIQPVRASAPRS
jgi:hypothetical protein